MEYSKVTALSKRCRDALKPRQPVVQMQTNIEVSENIYKPITNALAIIPEMEMPLKNLRAI